MRDPNGDRTGFGGHRYRTERLGRPTPQSAELTSSPDPFQPSDPLQPTEPVQAPRLGPAQAEIEPPAEALAALISPPSFADRFDDYIGFLRPRLIEAHRILKSTGSLFLHVDPREVHYCKVLLDEIFARNGGAGRACFQNEIIWAYDYGARPTRRWPAKHDNILWYTRHPTKYTFNLSATDRIPYMAPGLVGAEKAARGKTPTDVWWHTIVSPTGKEKTGYPTQKPLGILERIVRVHSNPGDTVLDFFAGSGTTGVAAARNHRHYILIDQSAEAIALMQQRLGPHGPSDIAPHGPSDIAPRGPSDIAPHGPSDIAPQGPSDIAPQSSRDAAPQGSPEAPPSAPLERRSSTKAVGQTSHQEPTRMRKSSRSSDRILGQSG